MREKIFHIVEPLSDDSWPSRLYDLLMIVVVLISMIPLLFKETNALFDAFEIIAVIVFIIDYILRFITADYYFKEHSVKSFLRYPFSIFAIIDMLSILPAIIPIHPSFKTIRLLRLCMALRFIRFLRYANSVQNIKRVFDKQKGALLAVFSLAFGYVIITAIIMFQVEPMIFDNFFDALYWATVSLTTVGYGDITAATTIGRLVTVASTFVGIVIVALPAGIVTAGYLQELANNEWKEELEKEKEQEETQKKKREE